MPAHESWCLHDAGVQLWHLHRAGRGDVESNRILSADCCVASVAFHPRRPTVLAAGTVQGDVLLWDLERESEQWTSSSVLMHGEHQDSVTGMVWGADHSQADNLLTCGLDGVVLSWQLNHRSGRLEPNERFALLSENIRPHLKLRAGGNGSAIGGTDRELNVFSLLQVGGTFTIVQGVLLRDLRRLDPELLCVARELGSAQVWTLGSKLATASDTGQNDLIAEIANGTFVAA
ncbi:hypothetical protein IscW_ISCW009933 [Ixodes scapularis]|uniref:Uncharacterized protein n=1 Tax=Ixodes scapularis TaxID=6945 RepID=B7PZY9_IXOSC|nr:hypothetical protein IscW_ISCW009933 [Ixodes scapularis]|eukprot:XP_002406508.1 hypothetical protein IscW_ISCW009933 [Ixodes scapularis]